MSACLLFEFRMPGPGLTLVRLTVLLRTVREGLASEYRIDFDQCSKWGCGYRLCDIGEHGCHAYSDVRNASSTYLNSTVRNLNPLTR